MKKLLVLTMVLVSFVSYGQKYVSKQQHINTINNQYQLTQTINYFTIKDGKILNTNKSGDKIFQEYMLGEVKKGDIITKYILNSKEEGTTGKIEFVIKQLDTFTSKSFKIVYELTLVE
jgi:hypothetical protein